MCVSSLGFFWLCRNAFKAVASLQLNLSWSFSICTVRAFNSNALACQGPLKTLASHESLAQLEELNQPKLGKHSEYRCSVDSSNSTFPASPTFKTNQPGFFHQVLRFDFSAISFWKFVLRRSIGHLRTLLASASMFSTRHNSPRLFHTFLCAKSMWHKRLAPSLCRIQPGAILNFRTVFAEEVTTSHPTPNPSQAAELKLT